MLLAPVSAAVRCSLPTYGSFVTDAEMPVQSGTGSGLSTARAGHGIGNDFNSRARDRVRVTEGLAVLIVSSHTRARGWLPERQAGLAERGHGNVRFRR